MLTFHISRCTVHSERFMLMSFFSITLGKKFAQKFCVILTAPRLVQDREHHVNCEAHSNPNESRQKNKMLSRQ